MGIIVSQRGPIYASTNILLASVVGNEPEFNLTIPPQFAGASVTKKKGSPTMYTFKFFYYLSTEKSTGPLVFDHRMLNMVTVGARAHYLLNWIINLMRIFWIYPILYHPCQTWRSDFLCPSTMRANPKLHILCSLLEKILTILLHMNIKEQT